MRVLSIDPGYDRVGFAVLERGTKKHHIVFSECFETGRKEDFADRLFSVGKRLEQLIEEYKPDCVALENLFFSRNKTTAMAVAEIRGCCSFVAKKYNLPTHEYTPKQVKGAITGNGNAEKTDVIKMLGHFSDIKQGSCKYDDEYDAIAVGVTHLSAQPLQNIINTTP